MAENESMSVREIYKLLDDLKKEIMAPTLRLEQKFDALESGRISQLEKDVASLQGKMMMIPILISTGITLFGFILNLILNTQK